MRAVREERTARDEINNELMPEFDNIRAAVTWGLGERRDVPAGAEIIASTVKEPPPPIKKGMSRVVRDGGGRYRRTRPDSGRNILGAHAAVSSTGAERVALADRAIIVARGVDDPRILADALSGSAFANLKAGNVERAAVGAAEALHVPGGCTARPSKSPTHSITLRRPR